MKLLALETSNQMCSVALHCEGVIRQHQQLAARRHGELLLPMIEGLLAEVGLAIADLDGIAFGRGPGSFTGVRVATAVAQGLALGADVPALGISTLAAIARSAWRRHGAASVLTAIDARLGEIYWSCFAIAESGEVTTLLPERVAAPESVAPPAGIAFGAGDGWALAPALLARRSGLDAARIDAELRAEAGDIAALAASAFARGEAGPAETALPVYLRDRVAEKPQAL